MHDIWLDVLSEVETIVSHAAFSTWFKNTDLLSQTDDKVVISVPNIFVKRQLEAKFNNKINEVLKKYDVTHGNIEYVVKTSSKKAVVSREITSSAVEKKTVIKHSPTEKPVGNGLNERYTFSNFIVGSSNDLAYTACQTVVKNPGTKYNPLFLYGGSGLGKTHLMQAVGNQIIKEKPDTKVLYITTEDFYKDFVDSLRFKKGGFSDRYRNVDVLVVDDMQFIAGKEKSQDEFFHTFNKLHQNNKQIIISSDRPPKEIPTLTDRLRSRFEWGMAIDIQMPDFETRCAILQAKASLSGVVLKQEVVEFLANGIKNNIRELEGVLNQLMAFSEMRGIEPDLNTAEGLIAGASQPRYSQLTPKQIINTVSAYFQISPKDITSSDRSKYIVTPRQIAMYLLRTELNLSFPKIANELGRKDHTTAMHSIDKIDEATKVDFLVREQVSEIKDKLYAK
ncbi:MAG: chromosomal replication initiator protein DnaA [Candidatus Nomurabacteria bacterium]|jgi:chromosomal replication initiator protein|nr:chromosomal replication initiator protein DnaA [Candidatus Nomurabacteria bacterium]